MPVLQRSVPINKLFLCQTDPNLLRLPAPSLHGTFQKAYSLLTKINAKIGWDNLLKARSAVFVMEEVHPNLTLVVDNRNTVLKK